MEPEKPQANDASARADGGRKSASAKKFKPFPMEEIITPAVVDEIFANYDPSLKVLRFESAKGTQNGDNYLSLMYTIDVETVAARDQPEPGPPIVFHLMFKTIPRNPVRIAMVQPLRLFQREILMYTNILAAWRSRNGFDSFPKCLHALYNEKHRPEDGARTDYIAMENLRQDGYKMLPRFQFLDLRAAEFVVQELAKFHALSFNEWRGDGELILSKYPILVDPVWVDPGLADPLNKIFIDNTFPELQKLLRINDCDEETCAKLATFSHGIEKRIIPVLHMTSDPRFPNVINHGDPWTNNFMFKYDQEGNVSSMKFVDFQVAKVGSRVIDLSYMLYTSLQIPVLNEHLMKLLRLYYDKFSEHTNANANARADLTWGAFIDEWGTYRLYGLTNALIFCPAMNANPDNIPDFETLTMEDFAGQKKTGGKANTREGRTPSADKDKDKSDFSNFMKSEHIASRVINLVKNHI